MTGTSAAEREWDAAIASGALRLVVGIGLVRLSALVARLGGAADDVRVTRAVRVLGARDIALAVSAFAASRPGRDVATQLRLQAAADALDGTLVAVSVRRGWLAKGRGLATVAIAAGSAGVEVMLARRLAALRA